jgi:hypothetical protein
MAKGLLETMFLFRYKSEFGFLLNRTIQVDDIRVRGVEQKVHRPRMKIAHRTPSSPMNISENVDCVFESLESASVVHMKTRLYASQSLKAGDIIKGTPIR